MNESERAFYEWWHATRDVNQYRPIEWMMAAFMAGWLACTMQDVQAADDA